MIFKIDPDSVIGLGQYEKPLLAELLQTWEHHRAPNEKKNRYYEGRIPLGEVNLGIALPEGMQGLEIGCSWGAKCVDVLAARSMFDGFVGENGEYVSSLDTIVRGNSLVAEYPKATRDELKYGCTFATLSRDEDIGCKIRFHSPRTAAARWNGALGRIDAGFAIIGAAPDETKKDTWKVDQVNLYEDDVLWVLRQSDDVWIATWYLHPMGRPLMEPMIWNATSDKPFGRSRIKDPVRRLIQGYVRTIANASIGLEFSTAPQKYLLGVSDEQFDALVNHKFAQYVGNILAATADPNTGEKPSFGQLTQGTITPHVEMLKLLAAQFGAATGLNVTDTGVINDANPSSADAIQAADQTLISMAEELNRGNGNSLRTIALMAQAVAADTDLNGLTDEQRQIFAHFRSPSMPSVAATADAAVKIAASRQGFAQTDVFLEMLGFDPADIRRIKAQEQRARGLQLITELEA